MRRKSIKKLGTTVLLASSLVVGSIAGTLTSSPTVNAATATPKWYTEAYQEIASKGILYGGYGYNDLSMDQKKELYNGIQSILKSLNLTDDQYNNAKKIYEYVVTHVTDSPSSDNYKYKFSAYGAYKGHAVCMGYAHFYSALCNAAGITCWIKLSPEHAWNIVEINGKQYTCDTRYDSYAREFYGQNGNLYCMIEPDSYETLTGNKATSTYRADKEIYSVIIDSPFDFSDLPYQWDGMYRVYNPNSGEHFYTDSTKELEHLESLGWKYESYGWDSPTYWGKPVYRLYNANSGDHHYTISAGEKNSLVKAGWKYEGIGWKSGGDMPVYREYNPNAKTGSHNYTTSKAENDALVKAGWKYEGIAWYSMNPYEIAALEQ